MCDSKLGIPIYSERGSFVGYECPYCFNRGEYSTSWDSFACLECVIWLDSASKFPDSPYYGRPEVPMLFNTPFGKGVS